MVVVWCGYNFSCFWWKKVPTPKDVMFFFLPDTHFYAPTRYTPRRDNKFYFQPTLPTQRFYAPQQDSTHYHGSVNGPDHGSSSSGSHLHDQQDGPRGRNGNGQTFWNTLVFLFVTVCLLYLLFCVYGGDSKVVHDAEGKS